jgi:hypothetical protein
MAPSTSEITNQCDEATAKCEISSAYHLSIVEAPGEQVARAVECREVANRETAVPRG